MFSTSYAEAITEREQGKDENRSHTYVKQGKYNRDERSSENNDKKKRLAGNK